MRQPVWKSNEWQVGTGKITQIIENFGNKLKEETYILKIPG